MKKIILSQVLTDNGRIGFEGLCDMNGFPVRVELECDSSGAVLDIVRKDQLTEDDIDRICNMHPDCKGCPLIYSCGGEDDEREVDDDE